jgi:hypothetical protein
MGNMNAYFISPDGEVILEVFNYGPVQFTSTIEVSTLNKDGIVLNKAYFPTKIGDNYVMIIAHQFSSSNNYLLDFDISGTKGPIKQLYYLYDRCGVYVSSFEGKGLPIKLFNDYVTMIPGRADLKRHIDIITVRDKFGEQLVSYEVAAISATAATPDDEALSRMDDLGDIYVSGYGWPGRWQYLNRMILNGGTVQKYMCIDSQTVLVNLLQQKKEQSPGKEVYESSFYVLGQNFKELLSCKTIEWARDDYIARQVKGNIFILFHRSVESNNYWAEQVGYEEPKYDLIQIFSRKAR